MQTTSVTSLHLQDGRLGYVMMVPPTNRERSGRLLAMIVNTLNIDREAFAAGTGWEIKAEGACKDEVCVPLDDDGSFDLAETAARLGMAVVHDEDAGLWSIGPETLGGRSLATAQAPELVLPDVMTGREVRLSSFLGTKVLIAAWAPY